MGEEYRIKAKTFTEYGDDRCDYANGKELMVEITLAEYRDLIKEKVLSTDAKNKLMNEKYELKKQIEELQKELKAITSLTNWNRREENESE